MYKIKNIKMPLRWFFLGVILTLAVFVPVSRQHTIEPSDSQEDKRSADKIIILYTNDIHCSIETDESSLGAADVANLKEWAQNTSEYVTLVDCGDAIQGESIETFSKGEWMMELMNELGYDVCTFGDHEFGYGVEQILEMVKNYSDAKYVSCNFMDLRKNSTVVNPYTIVDYDGIKVAYVGISTPETIDKSAPECFMDEDGGYAYGFCQGENENKLYAAVQSAVDNARAEGADYVVALAHLGIREDSEPYRSTDVIAHTTGIDVMLDGHSHSVVQGNWVPNKEGKEILLSSTGTRFANVGCLIIDTKATPELSDDLITTTLISNETYRKTEEVIGEIQLKNEELQNAAGSYGDGTAYTE